MDNLMRLDSAVLERAEITSEGFLKCPAQVTRPGIFTYWPNGKSGAPRRELRRAEEVFRADSMASLQSRPFVNGHPYALGGEVTAKNATKIMKGYTGAPAYKNESGNLCVDTFICDEATIKDAKAGKIALSAGYTVDTIETPGVWEGQRYDAEQVNIRYNHVALVKVGRAGKEAKLRLDEDLNQIPEQETDAMVKIKLDSGKEIEVSEDVAAAFKQVGEFQKAEKSRADDAESEVTVLKNQVSTLQGAHDDMKTRLDALTSDEKAAKEKSDFKARVKSRSALIATAQSILPVKEHARLDDMEDSEIMKEVIKLDAADPELKLDDNEAYLRGRFEHAMAARSKTVKSGKGAELGAKIAAARADGKDKEDDEETETMEERKERKKKEMVDRYKKPIGEK
jgi:hypothetical protein